MSGAGPIVDLDLQSLHDVRARRRGARLASDLDAERGPVCLSDLQASSVEHVHMFEPTPRPELDRSLDSVGEAAAQKPSPHQVEEPS